jgi:hypothetical protein
MKTGILVTLYLLTISLFASSQTTYFIDFTDGVDEYSGTSASFPWKSLNKVNSFAFQPGDSILFKCGETWRGQLLPKSGNSSARINYGSYGIGELPNLLGSYNMNLESDWTLFSGNIWKCKSLSPTDVGNIIFDNENSVGIKKWNLTELLQQDDYYYNISSEELYLYSNGNPAVVHSVIECALRNHIINYTNCSYANFESLSLKYGSAHGFGGSNTNHLTIKNCELSWIGGGDLNMDGQIRYGNAIEFWGNSSNCIVDGNKIWEIFDTGVTNQCSYLCTQQDIIYRNNVIWNCGMAAVEIWNRPETSTLQAIFFENNTCVDIGFGWSETQRDDNLGSCYAEFSSVAQTDNIYIRNNIFVNPKRFFFVYHDDQLFLDLNIDYNCYYKSSALDTFNINYSNHNLFLVQDFNLYQEFSNFESNSIFNLPEFINTGIDPYHITSESPCVDAGMSLVVPTDHMGISRPQGTAFDIGAYETLFTSVSNKLKTQNNFQIYPNPSKGDFSICNLKTQSIESLKIQVFDVTGRQIKQLKTDTNTIINLQLPQGNYFIQIVSKTTIETLRFDII